MVEDVRHGRATIGWTEFEKLTFSDPGASGTAYNVAVIRPSSRDRTEVVLRGGEKLLLEDSQDVSENNDGVSIYEDSAKPTYLEWSEVEEIRLD